MFDAIYAGLTTFLFAAFGKLSYQNFQRWRLEEAEKTFELTADLKRNFISLISHNLNTPIARMQGLVDVLLAKTADQAIHEDLSSAGQLVARLQVGIRSVLVSTAVEDRSLNNVPMTLKTFEGEFLNVVGSFLEKLGRSVVFEYGDCEED
ncbi:unnamed protein product, partial [marine sediment metagenome]